MASTSSIIIDAYSHISPPKFTETLRKGYPGLYNATSSSSPVSDLEARFRIMDMYPGIAQVLTIQLIPPLETFGDSERSVDLAKMANDEMAELILKYRDRFVAAIALLPMNNIDAALKETDRAIKDLGFKGIYLHSNINGKPLDSAEFLPFWEKMANYNLPVYIHPWRGNDFADYVTEKESKYNIAGIFGWPYETTVAMTRIVFSGILEKYPNLKIITHHCGGMVPYYAQRIHQHYGREERGRSSFAAYLRSLSKFPLEYYKMFYNDTAVHGNTAALMLAYDFWGADHLLFGADMPLGDYYHGVYSYRQTINAIEEMNISEEERRKIYADNALKLLRIPI